MGKKIEFGTDGIRGVAGEYPLDPATVLRIGRALGKWLRGRSADPKAIIGRDTRVSGAWIANTLALGMIAEGVNVTDRQVINTPGVAYLTHAHHFDLGVVVSASHNPAPQNGIKILGKDGFKLNDADEETVEALIAAEPEPLGFEGYAHFGYYVPGRDQYQTNLLGARGGESLDGLKVVLDCANGAGYFIAPDTFQRAGASVVKLNTNPDGFNINLRAGSEHVRRNRDYLHETVQLNQADVGFAFDGDADRVVAVTPDGVLIDGDHLLGILALEMKRTGNLVGDTVVATEMSNSGLERFLKDQGIKLVRTKVGDRFVMDAMRQGGYTLGGEQAGHIILLENGWTAGDGIYTALKIAALIARNKRAGGESLSALTQRIPRYPQVIASAHLSKQVDLSSVSGLEALRQETLAAFKGMGRVNLRFSGTEPNLLRAMVEGGEDTPLDEVVRRALALCGMVAQAAQSPNPMIDVVDCMTGASIKLQGA
ncbi:MAG: phosphoglucosamine mutase [Anaerolinea sp.]|nr:phosphoglucosamine mutase [Anaerolinea sp.]